MKKLNLDDTWRLCLQQWRWIVKQIKKDPGLCAISLKRKWLQNHGFKIETVTCGCFFCYYNYQRTAFGPCRYCPGRKVDETFSCDNDEYDYDDKPIKFNKELIRLNKIRLAKKVKK